MQALFTISVLCFAGVLWAALALARRIKAGQSLSLSFAPTQHDFKYHLLSVVPDASTRTAILPIEGGPISPTRAQPAEEITSVFRSAAEPAPGVLRRRLNELNQSVHDIAANKQWILPPHAVRTMRLRVKRVGRPHAAAELASPVVTTRKPPQSASHSDVVHRLDLAYFGKDPGDLTDPYQTPPRLRANERRRRDW